MKSRSSNLLTLFSASSIAAVIVILVLAYVGIWYIYQQNVTDLAERESVSVGKALYAQERALLTGGDASGATSLTVANADFERLDRRMRDYLAPFNITKIKAFNPDGRIVYSTDSAIIGSVSAGNESLQRALRGEAVAEIESKEHVSDLYEEERFDVDIVETYLPVRNEDGEIIGSFEVYMDMTPFREQMAGIVRASMVVLPAILLLTFGFQFLLMRKGTRQLHAYEAQLRSMAVTDELTGLANRRFVLERARQEFERLGRLRPPEDRINAAGCIMVDLDHFKGVNDTYGHAAGDAILRQLAQRLKPAVRPYDILGRFGGEEFVLLLPHTDLERTKTTAERIRQLVRGEPFVYGEHRIDITASLGVACTRSDDTSMEQAIQRADDNLYVAKNAGRDRVASPASADQGLSPT